MRSSIALLAVFLAACQTTPPLTVSVEIPVPCVDQKKRPTRPNFVTEADLAAMNDYQAANALELHRVQSMGYIGELEAVVDGCARLPAR
jgi:hypothetical protein